jgi:hypothetical protein
MKGARKITKVSQVSSLTRKPAEGVPKANDRYGNAPPAKLV